MKVRDVQVRPLDVHLHEPFGIAGGTQDVARNLVVTVELDDGTTGQGEAAPLPAFNGETQQSASAAIEHARDAVVGLDARRWRHSARVIGEATHSGAARCALETALLDALGRASGISLWAFFGGSEPTLATDVTIPTGSVERAREAAARWAAAGFATLKVKIGGAPPEEDVARLVAIHEAAPACRILLDANASMSADQALALLEALRGRAVPVAVFEQPVAGDDWAGLQEVARRGAVPVAVDESVAAPRDVARSAEHGARVVNVKPMKSGMSGALDIALAARGLGLGLMIGGMVETRLAMSASACLAAGLGGFDWIDLDTPMFLADDPVQGGFVQTGPTIDVSGITSGHGARVRGASV